jgi:hypothetical protein
VGSFADQATMLKDVQGRTIQPLISAGETIVPPQYTSGMRKPITWNDDADQFLIELVERCGRRWKLISQQLTDFIESECKK